jgi:hypothetical protein
MVKQEKKNIAEAVVLEDKAATLLKQSAALMDQARALREESMRLRELARRLRPAKVPAAMKFRHSQNDDSRRI